MTKKELLEESSAIVSNGFNQLGYQLASQFSPSKESPNFLVSSYSIGEALTVICNGADESNENEIKKALNLEGDMEEINRSLVAARRDLAGGNSVTLNIANGLWVDPSYKVLESFKEVAEKFHTETSTLKSKGEINQWVKKQTDGKIQNIVSDLDKTTKLILVNAVFFKGIWTQQFKEENTKLGPFHGLYGKSEVEMMSLTEKKKYLETELFQAIRLPYKSPMGSEFETLILLPKKESSNDSVLQYLKEHKLESFQQKEISLTVPKVHLEHEFELQGHLRKLGMVEAFNRNKCQFSKLSQPSDLYVSSVFHKCVLDMDEHGTVAAAATAVKMCMKKRSQVIEMIVDRPFVMLLRESKSGIVLFTALVNHCSEAPKGTKRKAEE